MRHTALPLTILYSIFLLITYILNPDFSLESPGSLKICLDSTPKASDLIGPLDQMSMEV